MKKKVSGKELVEPKDEFSSFIVRILEYINTHRTIFMVAGAAVLVTFAGFLALRTYSQIREADAALEFGKAYSYYQVKVRQSSEKGSTSIALVYANALKQFEEVVKNYRNTEAGKMAMLYAGQCAFWGQQHDQAISYYKQYMGFLKDDDPMRQPALSGLGYAYQAKGDCNKALEYFQMIADSNGYEKAGAYYNMAQCYEKLNDHEKAQQMMEKIKKEFPDSMLAQWIALKTGKTPEPVQKKEQEKKP